MFSVLTNELEANIDQTEVLEVVLVFVLPETSQLHISWASVGLLRLKSGQNLQRCSLVYHLLIEQNQHSCKLKFVPFHLDVISVRNNG
jgi:hypothetical protein